MRRLTLGTGQLHIALLLAWAAFWPVEIFFYTPYVKVFINALVLSVSLGIMATYLRAVVLVWRKPIETINGGDLLIVGIFAAWLSAAERTFWSDAFELLGHPSWMSESAFSAFMGWQLFTGGVLHQAAKGAVNGHIPNSAWRRIGITTACGVALFSALVLFFAAQFGVEQ